MVLELLDCGQELNLGKHQMVLVTTNLFDSFLQSLNADRTDVHVFQRRQASLIIELLRAPIALVNQFVHIDRLMLRLRLLERLIFLHGHTKHFFK